MHLLLDDGRGLWPTDIWPEHLYYARELVGEGGYVVEVVQLGQLDVVRWQLFLDLCGRQRLIPILRLATTFDREALLWPAPPTDSDGVGYTDVAQRYRDFLAQLRWPWPTKYAIIGNEPNRGDEWGNLPNPAAYANYLIAMSAALRSVGVTVLGPALDLYCPNSNGARIGGYRFLDAETFLRRAWPPRARRCSTRSTSGRPTPIRSDLSRRTHRTRSFRSTPCPAPIIPVTRPRRPVSSIAV